MRAEILRYAQDDRAGGVISWRDQSSGQRSFATLRMTGRAEILRCAQDDRAGKCHFLARSIERAEILRCAQDDRAGKCHPERSEGSLAAKIAISSKKVKCPRLSYR